MTFAGSHLRAVGLWALVAFFATAGLSGQRYTFRQYGAADGLGNLSVDCLLQDRTGYIWVGTDNGLFRYDGDRFTAFGHAEGLPNSEILGLAESPDGFLWVATQGGLARRSGSRFDVVEGGGNNAFQAVAFDSKKNIYLQNSSEIIRGVPDGRGWYRFSRVAEGAMRALLVDGQGVWFASDTDVWRLRDGKTERIGSTAGLPADQWTALARDTGGNLWARSANLLFELAKNAPRFVDRSKGITHTSRSRLYADRHGRVFVSSNSGVIVFDGASRTFIDPDHGLPADSAAPVLLDRDESLWIGMFGGGVVRRLGHGEWLSWKKEDGLLHNSVWSVMHDSAGRLWVGTSGGLSIFGPDGKLAHSWTQHNGLAGDWVRSIVESPTGDVLAGTYPGGITRFRKDGVLLRTYDSASGSGTKMDQVIAMAIDRQGRLWVTGPEAGVFRSRMPLKASADLKFDSVDIPGMPAGTLFRDVVSDDRGMVWITSSHGLIRYDGSSWKVFGESDGLRSSDLSAIAERQGTLWVGYRDALGVARLRFDGDRAEATRFGKQDGLSSDLIYALAIDRTGRLWATTDNGVDVFNQDRGDQGRWLHYGREDGLIWDDGNDLALSVDHENNLWIGTSGGLSRLEPLPYALPKATPAVVLTSVEGGGKEFQAGDRPVLTHAQDSLLIRFSGLNYASETSTRFRYRLVGYKTAWTETRERSVHFEGLPGGRYIFEVAAAGPDGSWNPSPARFAFSIRPPWWQSWWFLTACLLTAGFLAAALWRYRVRVLVAQKELLKRQVADQTAELIKSHRQLEELAYCDVLTSLPNRRMFTEQFRARLAAARAQARPFALLLVDLDHFKRINDTHGHDAGDAVLFETAVRLRVAVRESDCVARLGGDEFAILLVTANQSSGVEAVCTRIVDSIAGGIPFNGETLNTGCSIGIARYPEDGDSQEGLYKSADLALYEAKRTSRNGFCWYHPEIGRRSSSERAMASQDS